MWFHKNLSDFSEYFFSCLEITIPSVILSFCSTIATRCGFEYQWKVLKSFPCLTEHNAENSVSFMLYNIY